MKVNNCRGDLTDISAKQEALVLKANSTHRTQSADRRNGKPAKLCDRSGCGHGTQVQLPILRFQQPTSETRCWCDRARQRWANSIPTQATSSNNTRQHSSHPIKAASSRRPLSSGACCAVLLFEPKYRYFHYLEKSFLDQSIQKYIIFNSATRSTGEVWGSDYIQLFDIG